MAATTRPVARRPRSALAAVFALLSLPPLLVAWDAASFRVTNRPNGGFVFAGEAREYLLHVPATYEATKPVPLVISLHGAGGWPVQQMDVSGWNRVADAERFIVVYPSAARGVGPNIWHVDGGRGLSRDIGFIAALIDTLQARYRIDPTRIYVNGLSNGGGMSFVLSCALSDRVAAVGVVAAAQTLPWSWCTDRHAVPMIAFHGTADPDIPFAGGTSWMAPGVFPNVVRWTQNWARRNHCAAQPVKTAIASDVTRLAFGDCADGADVLLYTIKDGGHTWPGGRGLPEWWLGRTTNSIDATREMWAFFQAHPRPRM